MNVDIPFAEGKMYGSSLRVRNFINSTSAVLFNFQDFSSLQAGGAVSFAVVVPKLSAAGRDLLQVCSWRVLF